MRTFEELQEDLRHAMNINDAEALMRFAGELEELGTTQALAIAHNTRGIALRLGGTYTKALEHFYRALDMYTELGDRAGVATVTGNIGSVHSNTGNYPEALEHLHRAVEVHKELGDFNAMAGVTGNIGTVHLATGGYPEALEHYHRALEMFTELGNRADIAIVIGNIGNAQNAMGNYAEALEHLLRSLEVHAELGDRNFVAIDTVNIISVLLKAERYADAESRLHEMDAMQVGDPRPRFYQEQHRASIREHHGEIEATRVALNTALDIAVQHSLASEQAMTHQRLRDLALKQNDLQAYVRHNDEFTRIADEIRGKEAMQKMAVMDSERKMEVERREREKERELLYGALPEFVATRMLRGEDVSGDHHDHASVLFLDVAGFTTHSGGLDPRTVTELLDRVFHRFDEICEGHGVVKIKTIGDAYLAVAFADADGAESTEQRAASAAIEMVQSEFSWPDGSPLQFRIGMHSGSVVAGVLGKQRLQYDVWGDTVNIASRMESSGEPGRIQVSSAFADALGTGDRITDTGKEATEESRSPISDPRYPKLTERGELSVKGKGPMTTFWLEGA